MLRPSRPMMRPFMSSDGSSTIETVVSAAWLAATRCRASATRLRARRLASVRRLLVELAHSPCELVPHELFRALRAPPPWHPPCRGRRSARARVARLPSQPSALPGALCVRLTVGEPLVTPLELLDAAARAPPPRAARAALARASRSRSSSSRSVSAGARAASSFAASSDSRRNAVCLASRLFEQSGACSPRRCELRVGQELTAAHAPTNPARDR